SWLASGSTQSPYFLPSSAATSLRSASCLLYTLIAPPWVKPNRSWPVLAATSAAHLAGSSPARMWSIATVALFLLPQSAAHLSHQASKAGTKCDRASTLSDADAPPLVAGCAAAGFGASVGFAAGAGVGGAGAGVGAPPPHAANKSPTPAPIEARRKPRR